MKRLTIAMAMLCIVFNSAFCQDTVFAEYQPFRPPLNEEDCDTSKHISPSALNIYFNKQMSRYLSGSEDLVMNKSYAILDNEDNEITLGGTWARRSEGSMEYVDAMYQLGVKIKADDSFGEIWNKEDGLAASAGFFWKGTLFSKGQINFGKLACQNQDNITTKSAERIKDNARKVSKTEKRIKKLQSFERYLDVVYREKYKKGIETINNDLNTYYSTFGKDSARMDSTTRKGKFDKQKESLYDKLKDEYMHKVHDNLVETGQFVGTHKAWLSAEIFIPITPTEYLIAASNTSTEIETIQLAPFSGEIIGSYLYTRKSGLRYFGSFGFGVQAHNSITRDDKLDKTPFKTFVERDEANPDIELTETSSKDVYVGDIDRFILIPTFEGNFTMMLGGRYDFLGLSASSELRLDSDNTGWYWKFGVPFSLKGKDDETKANFEPLVKWDTNDRNALFGISVGLPLGKPIY